MIKNSAGSGQVNKISKFQKIRLFFCVLPMVFKVTLRNIKREKFESEVFILEKIIDSRDVCLDIGGAYGRYAYPLSRVAGDGKIFSFEPGRYSFYISSLIKKIFRMKNVLVIKKALAKESKTAFLISPVKKNEKIGHSLSYISDKIIPQAKHEPIEVTTIDEFISENNVSRLNFIKCDTEGSEMQIIYGGEQAIKKFRPFILAEIEGGHLKKFGNSLKEAEVFFRDISYDFFRCVEGDFFQVSDIGKDSNYFFIPREKVKAVVNSLNQSQPGSFSKRQK